MPLTEAGHLEHPTTREVAKHYLAPLKRAGIDTLILGCTHYPLLKPMIARIMGPQVTLVDSAETVAKEITAMQNAECRMQNIKRAVPKHEFYVSKKTAKFQEIAQNWLGHAITLKLAKTM